MADKAGQMEAIFQALYQRPVVDGDVRHVTHDAAFGIDQARQHQGDGDQLARLTLVLLDEVVDGLKQGVFDAFLCTLWQRIVGDAQHLARQIIQGDGGVVTAEADGDSLKMARLGDDRDGASSAGGGLLIDLFDQPALQ